MKKTKKKVRFCPGEDCIGMELNEKGYCEECGQTVDEFELPTLKWKTYCPECQVATLGHGGYCSLCEEKTGDYFDGPMSDNDMIDDREVPENYELRKDVGQALNDPEEWRDVECNIDWGPNSY